MAILVPADVDRGIELAVDEGGGADEVALVFLGPLLVGEPGPLPLIPTVHFAELAALLGILALETDRVVLGAVGPVEANPLEAIEPEARVLPEAVEGVAPPIRRRYHGQPSATGGAGRDRLVDALRPRHVRELVKVDGGGGKGAPGVLGRRQAADHGVVGELKLGLVPADDRRQVVIRRHELVDQALQVLRGRQVATDEEHGGAVDVLGQKERLPCDELGDADLTSLDDDALGGPEASSRRW